MMLGEILRRREIRAVTWFHADHWEPWGQGVTDVTLKRVEGFLRQAKASPFANKMTLFYLCGAQYRLKDRLGSGTSTTDNEILEAESRSELEHRLAREMIGELRAQTNVEFQVHLHHEHLVGNDGDWNALHREVKLRTDPQQDERRLHFLLRTELATLRHDTGLALDKWGFVHGMWALNGSDRTVCQIDNEMAILMEHGCWGDFSFPAGRNHCDPTILEQPYTCKPFTGAKAYDDPRCGPVAVDVGAAAIRDDRFLIWNSKAKHDVCSLDYYNQYNLQRVKNTDHIVFSWLSACPVIDQTLYIKTHSHSMDAHYYEDGNRIPLTSPSMEEMFDLLQRACGDAKVELKLATVDEVIGTLREVDKRTDAAPRIAASSGISPSQLLAMPLGTDGASTATTQSSLSMINLSAISTLKAWLQADPQHERSAGNYYSTRVARGRLFVDAELAIAEYSRGRFARDAQFFELGFGLGELSLLLALSGFRATGFESDGGRHAGATALVAALAQRGVDTSGLSLVYGAFPDALQLASFDPDGETVFVSTNVTSSHVMEHFEYVLRSLRLFDHLIIDVSRFGEVRNEESQRGLIARLHQLGFAEVSRVYSTGDTEIRHFARKSTSKKGTEPSLAPAVIEELRYSDLGNPVPRRLQRTPFHVFEGKEVAIEAVLPRLAHVPRSWLPAMPIRVATFPSPFGQPSAAPPPVFREGTEPGSGSFVFDRFGGHGVDSSYGIFRCLILDPSAGRDQRALEIFRFVAENTVHTCVDKAIILPWAKRTRYVRPDLLLSKLFLSDQPLGLHCDHASQVTAYLLHLSGYRVREVSVVDPATDSGHVVMEVFLPEQARWVMLDPDFGVVVTHRGGMMLGTAEIIAYADRERDLEVRRIVDKQWASDGFDVAEAFSGHLSWTPGASVNRPTVEGDSYYRMMDRFFLARREFMYRFDDGFEDTRLVEGDEAKLAASAGPAQTTTLAEAGTWIRAPKEKKKTEIAERERPPRGELRWAERLRELLVPVLRHRIERFGIEKTGAYNFYNVRLQKGELFSDYEIALARKLMSCELKLDCIHEIGSGYGQLVFLLGWNGFETLGFEFDRPRAQLARDLRQILALTDPQRTDNIQLFEGLFPSRDVSPPEPNSLILTTNLVTTLTDAQQIAIIEAMRQYSYVLVDIQRLFEKRVDEGAQQAALVLFSKAGFNDPELFLDLGASGRYYLFTNTVQLGLL